jgi:hypothetical protein
MGDVYYTLLQDLLHRYGDNIEVVNLKLVWYKVANNLVPQKFLGKDICIKDKDKESDKVSLLKTNIAGFIPRNMNYEN